MTYFAMVIVAEGDDADSAWENLTSNGHLVDAATFVGNPWEVSPLMVAVGGDAEFDTDDCLSQRRA